MFSNKIINNYLEVNDQLKLASGPQAIMDIFGWLSHNGELQLIINVFNAFVLVEETLLT